MSWTLVSYFLVFFVTAECQILSIDLKGGGPSDFHKMLLARGPDHIMKKWSALGVENTTIPLFKWQDSQYYGNVLIGHPGQKFKVIFDTSWASIWIPSKMCSILDVACQKRAKYDHSKSSTYIKDGRPFEIDFTNYKLKGYYSIDLFHVGQVNATNQTFAEVVEVPTPMIFDNYDGVIGLGFKSLAPDGINPLMDNLVEQGVISKNIFSFYFNRDPGTPKGGSLFLGGSVEKHYRGNFTYTPVMDDSYWLIKLNRILGNDTKQQQIFCSDCSAIIDTSSNAITGPAFAIEEIHLVLGASKLAWGRYMVPCGKAQSLPHITFEIEGEPFVLRGANMVEKYSWQGVTMCLTVFRANSFSAPYNSTWTLGAAFLSRYYAEFDGVNKRVGFAEAR